ncbi:MAG TPA: hypothetical protein VIP46_04150, partial [Pyrinomonadaceae bacterium]
MSILTSPFKSLLLAALLCACAAAALAQVPAQTPAPDTPPQDAEDEVIKVDTALIQTGVAVFDKSGRFVGDLRQEDFEVTVDGKPVTLSFFERNTIRRGAGPRAARR